MRFSTALLLLLWTLAALNPAAPALAGSRTLARVDGQPLTGEDLQEGFGSQHMGHTAFLASEGAVRKALDSLIEKTLLLQEAERMDLGSRPEIQAGIDDRVTRLSVKHLMKVEIEEPAQPTEKEIRAVYDQFTGHLLKVRQIVVPDRAGIEEIAALLADGESFGDLARQRSRVRSAQAEGLMPSIGWGTMEAAWDEVAFQLEPGEMSGVFASGGAWEIVLLEERIPAEEPPYEKARARIMGILLRRGLEDRERDLSARLFDKYEVAVKLTPFEAGTYSAALERDPETVVATWNGGDLRIRELVERANFAALEPLTDEQAAREIEELVRTSVTRPLALLEARARKYGELPDIQAAAQTYRKKAMLAFLHNEFIFTDVTVTDADIRSWYDSHTDEIRTVEKRFLSQILVKTEEEARAARQRLEQGMPFADLAREISVDSDTAPKGGALGWIEEKESPPGFQEVFSLPLGEYSQPVRTGFGWHLIRVLEIQPPRTLPFDEAKERIRKHLLKEKRDEKQEEWLAQLRDAAQVKINEEAVRAFVEENAASIQ